MSKKYYRFFGGLLTAQENWLNKMSKKGYRLIRTKKMHKITIIFLKIWAIRYFIKILISTTLLVRYAGGHGLKKADKLQQTPPHLTGNC